MTTNRVRYERIVWALRVTKWVALVAASAAMVLPGDAGRAAAAAAVGLVIAAPLVRVSWLSYRWWRWGDRAFGAVAGSLLVIVGIGAVLAYLTR